MKNNKLSFYFLVLIFSASLTSVIAQNVGISTVYSMASNRLTETPPVILGDFNGGPYTVGPGSRRLLVAFVMGEDGGDTNIAATAVTYGGLPMTKAVERGMYAPGFDTYTSMWYLKEADIINAVGDLVQVTWNTNPSSQGQVDCVVFQNVDQTNPVSATGSNTATGLFVETSAPLLANAGDMMIAQVATSNYSLGVVTWENSFIDIITGTRPSASPGFGASLAATKVGAGVTETPRNSSVSTQARRVIVAGVIKKFVALSVNDNQLATNAINVYPNPSSGIVNIDSAISSEKEISVINSLGQVISTTKTSGNAQIDLKALNVQGFVILQVIADGEVSNHKIMVK